MKGVAVTGASGFIGGAVAKRLDAAGYSVHAFGRRSHTRVDDRLDAPYRSWDISVSPLDAPPPVDTVVHCAALVDDWGRGSRFEAVNVTGTKNVLATWPEAHFVHVSSASIYDPHVDRNSLSEDDADPLDVSAIDRIQWLGHYGRTKRIAESVVARARPGGSVILRPRGVFGSGDRTLLPRLLRRYRMGRLVVAGNPGWRLSLTHIDNLITAIERTIICSATGVYNVADPDPVELGTLLMEVLRSTGRKPRVTYLPVEPVWAFAAFAEAVHLHGFLPRPIVTRYQLHQLRGDFVLDTSRIRRHLGWVPTTTTLDGIRSLSCQGPGT